MASTTRRPLKSRDTKWAATIAQTLVSLRISPNTISLASILFAGLAGVAYYVAGGSAKSWQWTVCLGAAAACIQLRLLCNLLDGMVAMEGGLRSKSGELYNELPDRFSDALTFVGAGYAFPQTEWSILLGWLAAVCAVITAYARALGASGGAGQCFLGPMAKPHRMATLTVASLLAAAAPVFDSIALILPVALGVISAGCLLTIFRRCRRISRELEAL